MKISIFKNSYIIWNDYSKRTDCFWVFEIDRAKEIQLENGAEFEVIEWVLIITDNETSLEKEKAKQTEAIKIKYWEIIYWTYSQTDQNNTNARVTEINTDKLIENRDFTVEELADIEEARLMIAFIRDERKKCEDEILAL